MKKFISTCLSKAIIFLEKLKFKLEKKIETSIEYSSLSPINNCDIEGHYSKMLSWALENRKEQDIKNIALTGPYGSGKSSILKTFQTNYKGDDFKFLNISLATFKEERQTTEGTAQDELLRLIEISILQQIFYHEEDKKIPDSRFKKIKSYGKGKLILLGFCYLFFIIAIYNYFHKEFIQSVFKDFKFSQNCIDLIHYSGFTIIFFGLFFIIYKSVRIISSVTINKLKIQNAEVGIGDNLNKSILNHHLDEILYFFSVRPYNVVIIEDLDRFKETEIFTKLREINLLLNGSQKTKKKEITFIYAVRDDIFTDKERTKFFDFIIPVIPTINSSNSSEKLLEKKHKYSYDLSDIFIEDISFVIDDMRLLHNICNEFSVYKKLLDPNLIHDKLFALITYKNISPNDFMALSENKGILFNALNSKQKYIREKIETIEVEIEKMREEIKTLDSIYLKNIEDTRKLYVLKAIEKADQFASFLVNSEQVTVDKLAESENFEYFIKNSLLYERWDVIHYRLEKKATSLKFTFAEIEKEINPSKPYKQIEKETNELKAGKINVLRNKIYDLEKEKIKTRSLKIAHLIKMGVDLNFDTIRKDGDTETVKFEKNNYDLIKLLIRNGYIAEDYIDYISIFHEGSITRSDYQFSINIKNQNKVEFDYKLNNLKNLVSKINLFDFSSEYVLNYNLVDFLIANSSKYSNQIENVFSKLKDESKSSIDFINRFLENTENIELFISTLCTYWTNIWNYIENNPDYTDNSKNKIFLQIIEYTDISTIKKIAAQSNFKKPILKDPLFLNTIQNKPKLKEIIEVLDLHFEQLDFENSSEDLLEFIYKHGYYELNSSMIKSIIKQFGNFSPITFDNSNYLAIKESQCHFLTERVKSNILEYIENVYVKISSNIHEDELCYTELLNNVDLEMKGKLLIIKHVQTKITNLNSVNDTILQDELISNDCVITKWENLLLVFNNHEKINNIIIEYINIFENAIQLAKQKIPSTKVEEKNTFGLFWRALIQQNEISEESYALILKSGLWWYEDLDINNLSEKKVSLLIENNSINPTAKSFNLIKQHHKNLIIKLIEKHKDKFLGTTEEIVLDPDNLNQILKSTHLTNSEKKFFLNFCSEDAIISNIENKQLLMKMLIADVNLTVSPNLIEKILLNDQLTPTDRILLFNKNSAVLDNNKTKVFLTSLTPEYSEINNTEKKATIEDNAPNRELLNALEAKGLISSTSETKNGLRVNHKKN
jgi:hypothetical protein